MQRARVVALIAAGAVAACAAPGDEERFAAFAAGLAADAGPATAGEPPAPAEPADERLDVLTLPDGGPTTAHDWHARQYAYPCAQCHDHPPSTLSFDAITFSGGTTMSNGGTPTATRDGGTVTCAVGCHNPVRALPARAAPGLANTAVWSAAPLGCPACHDVEGAVMSGGTVGGQRWVSGHGYDATSAATTRADCLRCHVAAGHTRGVLRVTEWGGAERALGGTDLHEQDAFCYACHDGTGGTLHGAAPPNVSGFRSASGDFHGTRAGTGSGGTLKPPYARGAAALACRACHDHHGSTNTKGLAAAVNGTTLPAGSIDSAGRGGEKLCEACHAGNYHAYCVNCHGANPIRPPEKCFHCHSHAGIRNFPSPDGDHGGGDCDHCHGYWYPRDPDRTPPVITSGPAVSGITSIRAVVSFTNDEVALGTVEFGVGALSRTVSGAYGTSHSIALTGLAPSTTYTYRVKATDPSGNAVYSATSTFATLLTDPPPTPTLQHQADVGVAAPTVSVTLRWNAVADPNGDPVEYSVQVDDATDFSSVNAASGWVTGTSWTTTLATGRVWNWRVMARDAAHPSYTSAWSARDTFTAADGVPPPAPTLIDQPDQYDTGNPVTVVLRWNAVAFASPQYEVQISWSSTFATVSYASGWMAGTSWTVTVGADVTWYWRVRARDPARPLAMSAWSAADTFSLWTPPSSCPLVYAWDGAQYRYYSDLQGPAVGVPADSPANRAIPYFAPEYLVLEGAEPDANGLFQVKIREVLAENTYLDQLQLLVVDHPPGYEIVSSTAEYTYTFLRHVPFTMTTAKDPVPPISATDQTGADILPSLLALDDIPAPANRFGDSDAYTLDFGPIPDTSNVRLLLDAWTVYDLPGGTNVTPTVQVQDAAGAWVAVRPFGRPAGDLKRMVVDLSDLFIGPSRLVRVNLGSGTNTRWAIDRIRLDTSAQVPVQVQTLDVQAADLHHRGRAPLRFGLTTRIAPTDSVAPDNPVAYGYGVFTRYGEVTPLLTASDDLYAIMRHGDEVTASFPPAAPPPAGTERTYILKGDLFYKGFKVDNRVEPLPFHGMTTYPPTGAPPMDAARRRWLEEYQTREYLPPGP